MTRTSFRSFRPAAIAAALVALAPVSQAAGFKAGDWDMTLGGFVNAYYTSASCSGANVGGLALAGKALGCGGKSGSTTIGNGLLPNALIATGKTTQDGVDIGVTLMIGSAVSTSSAIGANSGVDVRQGFMTLGNAGMGTFKLGRDYGLFGSTAILSDMTLLGVGAPTRATQQGRVSLGHIGAGYSYLGHYGQMTWSAPAMGPVGLSVGVMSPVDGGTATAGRSPQLQALATLDVGGGTKAWIGAKTQKFEDATNGDFTMNGVEVGAKANVAGVELLGNVQTGKGLGVLADGDSGDAKQTNWLLQGKVAVAPKVKVGLSYGESRMKDAGAADLKSNANTTLGAYYNLTSSVTLVGELSRTESKDGAGNKARQNGVSLGGIVFF